MLHPNPVYEGYVLHMYGIYGNLTNVTELLHEKFCFC